MSTPPPPTLHPEPPHPHGDAAGRGTLISTPGRGSGATSIVMAALVIPSMFFTLLPTMYAMLFTRGDSGGDGELDWVAPAVFWSLPVLFALLALMFGSIAVRKCVHSSPGWLVGVVGLSFVGVDFAVVASYYRTYW
ncbi:hypothetical protein [Pseudarthrobacter sp. N5]|uniref:hypothetical protein n=1 Tax=Pseudarthrobacter sp. N5 TaxID=3418416 RepID=UPI003CF7EC99